MRSHRVPAAALPAAVPQRSAPVSGDVTGLLNFEPVPPASTFAEGQQALMVKLLAWAGIGATAIVLGLVGLFVWGGWSPANERLILYIMAGVVAAYALANLLVIVSFSIGGPVGRIDLEATRNGLKLGANKESDHGPTVETGGGGVGAPAERPGSQSPPH
jgi:hypothetical protein